MEIKRDLYLQKLIERMNNGMVKVVSGLRRAGKSYLLFTLFRDYLLNSVTDDRHVIAINLDNINFVDCQKPRTLYDYVTKRIVDGEIHYVLIDEVQLAESFETVLNSFLQLGNLDVYVTGSNARFLSKDIVTEFRGRGDQVHLQPLSFAEYYRYRGGEKLAAFIQYATYGGLPKVALAEKDEQRASYLGNLLKETYLKDIVNRHSIRNDGNLYDLLGVLSSSVGGLMNPRKLSHAFKSLKNEDVSPMTIEKYLGFLSDSFLVSEASRFDIKGKRYIGTPHKYYFTDLGLRNAVTGFRQADEMTHLMENAIYNELVLRGYAVDVGAVSIGIRNGNGNVVSKQCEVDFVCNKGSERLYVQSAYTLQGEGKLNQEQRSLLHIHDSFKKMIVTFDPTITHYNDNGFLIMNIFNFLLGDDAAR